MSHRSLLLPFVIACLGGAGATACGRAGAPETAAASARPGSSSVVAARGRLQPRDGVVRLSGPSDFAVVVARLSVAEGDHVAAGQVLAVTDTHAVRSARVASLRARIETQRAAIARLQAELENAGVENRRHLELSERGIVAQSERDAARTRLAVTEASASEAAAQLVALEADLTAAVAETELAVVRAPRAGQVLKLHARAGERVGPDGILELGTTREMYAIAEVYETDLARVRPGQRARVRSPALPRELQGTVERVGLSVGRLTSLGTDPGLKSDARVVEAEIRLDDSAPAAGLTNLEVEVLIGG